MKKVFCKFCGKYVTDIRYLVEPDDDALLRLKEKIRGSYSVGTYPSELLGCHMIVNSENIKFQDESLMKTIANYGLDMTKRETAEHEKRESLKNPKMRFAIMGKQDGSIDSFAGGFFHLTDDVKEIQTGERMSEEEFASINGQYLAYDIDRKPACLLCCGRCHMRLETHKVSRKKGEIYYRSDLSTDKNINIMFLGTRASGKTVLLLAILDRLIKQNSNYLSSFRKLNDSYVSTYYDNLRINLFIGKRDKETMRNQKELPEATPNNQPPVTLEISKISNKDEYKYRVTFVDTMGESIHRNLFDPVEILKYSDAIVVIHPICTNENVFDISETQNDLLDSSGFIGELLGATMTKSKKPTMLLFNKCDIFESVAEEMMLGMCDDNLDALSPDKLKAKLKESQQIQLLRKVFFNLNSNVVISRICEALTGYPDDGLTKASREFYSNCEALSNNGVRIQCISPLGGADPNKMGISPMYVGDFINMLSELCEEISNGKQKI